MNRNFKRKYGVAIAFFSCLAIAFSTLSIAMKMSQKKLREEAFRTAEIEAETVKSYTNLLFLSTEWVMNSFLSSFADIRKIGDEREFEFKRILRERDSRKLEIKELQEMLDAFVVYNQFFNCMVVFEPGALSNAPDGMAVISYFEGEGKKNSCKYSEIVASEFYQQIDSTRVGQLKVNEKDENEAFVCTFGVPIFNGKDEVIGQCWVDIVMDEMSKVISGFIFKNDVVTFIMSTDGMVVCSSDSHYNGMYLKDILSDQYQKDFPKEWYNQMMTKVANSEYDNEVFTAEIGGAMTKTYYNQIKSTDFLLVTIKPESRITRLATNLQKNLMTIFVGAFLLLAFCLLYLFNAFLKENRAKGKLQYDLELAYRIQHSLLPPNPEISPDRFDIYGYQRTAKSVGGDLYSYFVKGDKLHFCIGDVSGKGVPAALLMSEIISLYKYIAGNNDDIVQIIKALNNSSMDESFDRNICTMIVGILDLKSGHLDFCNAGHNSPLFISGEEVRYIKMKANMPLYAFDDYPFASESIDLKPGDRLFLYTDGVTDAMNTKQEMFGQNELQDIVFKNKEKNFNKIVGSVLASIKAFAGKRSQYDDITILCIKYKGEE